MKIIIRCSTPEFYDFVTHAVLDLDEDLIGNLLGKFELVNQMAADDPEFAGIEYDRNDPQFVKMGCADDIGMTDEEFSDLSDGGWAFLPAKMQEHDWDAEEIRMRPVSMMVSGNVYWVAYDKHLGMEGRISTFWLSAKDLRDILDRLMKEKE